jgi:hypothetical protein
VFGNYHGEDFIYDFENGIDILDLRTTGQSYGDLNILSSGSNAIVEINGGGEQVTLIGMAGTIDASDILI